MSYKEIGELLGIGPQTAHKAATGLTWKHVRG